jgi:hypothetical protein
MVPKNGLLIYQVILKQFVANRMQLRAFDLSLLKTKLIIKIKTI